MISDPFQLGALSSGASLDSLPFCGRAFHNSFDPRCDRLRVGKLDLDLFRRLPGCLNVDFDRAFQLRVLAVHRVGKIICHRLTLPPVSRGGPYFQMVRNSIESARLAQQSRRLRFPRVGRHFRHGFQLRALLLFFMRSTGCPSSLSPSRRRPLHSANHALVTSGHWRIAAMAAGFRLRLGGGVALRLRFAKRFSPPSAPLSPLADRRPKPENPHMRKGDECANQ
jgi:hypothetical protein